MELNKAKTGSGGSKTLYTGFASMKVVKINPSKSELLQLLGVEETADNKEEIDYEKPSAKGDDMVQISFWLEADTPEKQLFNAKFYLIDKEVVSKSGKHQWVNQSGMSAYVDDEKNLQEWFSNFQNKEKQNVAERIVREAIQGEAMLYEFLTCWLGKVNFWGKDEDGNLANILLDKKKAFRNIDKYVDSEFRPLIDSEYVTNVTALATVYTTEKDGELKQYQNLYQSFIPATIKDGSRYSASIGVIRIACSTGDWKTNAYLKKYVDQLTGEHGTDDAYTLTTLQLFDPNKAPIQATQETLRIEPETGSVVANNTEY